MQERERKETVSDTVIVHPCIKLGETTKTANSLLLGERLQDYGADTFGNCCKIAGMFNMLRGTNLRPSDIALIQICLKTVRAQNSKSIDHAIDGAAYFDIYNVCRERESS